MSPVADLVPMGGRSRGGSGGSETGLIVFGDVHQPLICTQEFDTFGGDGFLHSNSPRADIRLQRILRIMRSVCTFAFWASACTEQKTEPETSCIPAPRQSPGGRCVVAARIGRIDGEAPSAERFHRAREIMYGTERFTKGDFAVGLSRLSQQSRRHLNVPSASR